jgi:hypothetical protein
VVLVNGLEQRSMEMQDSSSDQKLSLGGGIAC